MAWLEGKAAVVTGGSRGIGRAIAEALLERGARVTIGSATPARLEQAVAELEAKAPGRVRGVVCDVRDPDQCRELIDGAAEAFGRLDVLVNNAGVGIFGSVATLSVDDWRRVIDTNLSGVFYCSRAAIPHLERTHGWIINIGSLAGVNAFAGGAAYNASKFGLVGFSEALMQDVRHAGIRVSHVMPGSVSTEFSGRERTAGEDWKLQPEDIARVVIDLLEFPPRALPSRIEIRPSQPPRK
ncbi:MAG: SDR family oxidoreductase [bacterium]|jgi:3-oxoacyl-[acyl-carrier protein] reductase|nr:MAG: short-chain dehydrogenase [bacterium]